MKQNKSFRKNTFAVHLKKAKRKFFFLKLRILLFILLPACTAAAAQALFREYLKRSRSDRHTPKSHPAPASSQPKTE